MPRGPIERSLSTITAPTFTGTVTFGGVAQFADGSAATPSITFTNNSNRGWFNDTGSNAIGVTVGGAQQGFWSSAALTLFGALSFGSSGDITVNRDAADVLAQRRGTNAQTFRVYGTFTDASNYERLEIQANAASSFKILVNQAGTGSVRNLQIGTTSNSSLELLTGNSSRWQVGATTGHFIASTGNTYDIGNNVGNNVRTIHVGTSVVLNGVTTLAPNILTLNDTTTHATSYIKAFLSTGTIADIFRFDTTNNHLYLSTDGNGVVVNNLKFQGLTASFPSLVRSATSVEAKLADGSAYTRINASETGSGAAVLYSDATLTTNCGRITAPFDGVFMLRDSAGSSFGRLQFGGVTSSFPALKRNGAGIDVRLADDTNYASLVALNVSATDVFTNNAAALIKTTITLNTGAGAGAGTITNAPSAGNPTKWIPISDNGTTRYIPAW